MRHAAYSRSQPVTALWILTPLILVCTGVSLWATGEPAAWLGLGIVALVLLGTLVLLGRLTVEVDAKTVAWRYGFLGWPRGQQPLDSIAAVSVTEITPAEGWGIRRTRRGMVYNASGSGGVCLHLKDGREIRLGSAEPQRLAGFIQARLPATR
jgi:hypothetical protein